MAGGGTPAAVEGDNTPRPTPADERTLYWCEECGTELLLVVRGSGVIPRHCGTRMHERVEVSGRGIRDRQAPDADEGDVATVTPTPRRER